MRDIAFIVFVVALVVPLIAFRPWMGILAWNVVGLVNPHTYTWLGETFPIAVIVGGATLLGVLYTKERRSIPMTPAIIALGLFTMWCTVTTIDAWAGEFAWEQWRKVMKIVLMTFVTMILIFGENRIRALFATIAWSLAFFGIKGGIFTMLTGGQHRVQGAGGFLGTNTDLGLALCMALPMIWALAMEQKRTWARLALYATFWLTVLSTVFTYSRGALLGLAAVFAMLFFQLKHKVLAVALVIPAFVVALAFVPAQLTQRAETIGTYEQDSSSMERIQAWGVCWNIAVANPMGVGFNLETVDSLRWMSYANFSGHWDNITRAAHSIYLQVLSEQGFPGLLLFLTVMGATFVTLNRLAREGKRDPKRQWISSYARALRAGLIGYAVAGAFLSLAYFDLFYTFVALAAVLQRESLTAAVEVKTVPASVVRAAPRKLA